MDILQRERLLKFGAVPFTTDVIAGEFGDYSSFSDEMDHISDASYNWEEEENDE